jgi:hypothetical protein
MLKNLKAAGWDKVDKVKELGLFDFITWMAWTRLTAHFLFL